MDEHYDIWLDYEKGVPPHKCVPADPGDECWAYEYDDEEDI